MADITKIDTSLPHYEIRVWLASCPAGPEFDARFAEIAGLQPGPYSTDLNAVVGALNDHGYWWHLSHLHATVTPNVPAPGELAAVVSNAAKYDREGRPISYTDGFAREQPARALCRAWVKAIYDLPDAYYVVASHSGEILSQEPMSRERKMAFYAAREDHRQEHIRRYNEGAAKGLN